MNRISFKQLAVLFIVTRVCTEMIVIPGELIRYGADRFWAVLAAKPIVLLLFLPMLFFTARFKDEGLFPPAVRRGRAFGIAVGVPFIVVLFAITLETLIDLQLYISDVILDSMLFITGAAVISAAAFYGAIKGFSAISRSAIFALGIFAVLILLIGITCSDKADLKYLYPSFVRDGEYFLRAMLSEVSACGELLIFAVFCGRIVKKPRLAVYYYLAAVLVILEGLTLLYNLILGPYLTTVEYPLYYISSMSDIVLFQRLDGIDAVVWVLCGIIKLALLLAAAGEIFANLGNDQKHPRQKLLLLLYTLLLLASAYFVGTDKMLYDRFEAIMHSAIPLAVAGTLIPIIVLIAGKKRQGAKGGANEKS